jgi:glycosyltransferase involved in cell wall biosynthesis
MKRVLMLASVASMIDQFNMPNIALLRKLGYEVDVACNFIEGNTCSDERVAELKQKLQDMHVRCYQIDFARNIKHMGQNMRALRQVEGLMKQNGYAFCHCHSPIGGVVARIAGHRTKTKVIYTAHGFHFYQGAPVMNWLVYYPVEKMLSRWTDVLITINHEDYKLAKKKFKMKKLTYVPGIGIDTQRESLSQKEKEEKRKELGIPQDAFLITNAAEFTPNKNQKTVIEAIEQLHNPNIYFVMCGIGQKKAELEQYVKEHGLEEHIRFVGFRNDLHEILQTSDCFVLSSFREGLSVALMEAMAEGLPVVCSRIRGNVDLIKDGEGGILISPQKRDEYINAFKKLYNMKNESFGQFLHMGEINRKMIYIFGRKNVENHMKAIYFEKMNKSV